MSEDAWAGLADAFVDGGYASVKGRVRTYVMHRQLLRHLPAPAGGAVTVLDVGGGAAHQSLPLAPLGYRVTVLDPSAAMLATPGPTPWILLTEDQLSFTKVRPFSIPPVLNGNIAKGP